MNTTRTALKRRPFKYVLIKRAKLWQRQQKPDHVQGSRVGLSTLFNTFKVCPLIDSYVVKFASSKRTYEIYNELRKSPVKSFVKCIVNKSHNWTFPLHGFFFFTFFFAWILFLGIFPCMNFFLVFSPSPPPPITFLMVRPLYGVLY